MTPAPNAPTSGRRALLLLVSGALLVTFGWILAGGGTLQAKTPTKPSDNAATIGGQPVTMADVNAKAKESLDQLELNRKQMETQVELERQKRIKAALDSILEDRLLELESKATNKTKEQLLADATQGKAVEVTDAEVDAYYAQLQAQRPQGLPPKDQIAPKIREFLQTQKAQTARAEYFKGLRAKHDVQMLLDEPRVEVAAEGPSRGAADAPVTIVEFSDFECPYCKNMVPTLQQIEQKYGKQVRVIFRTFPLVSIHPHAQKAAEAALCADEQGKFWEMHDAMFGDQTQLEVPALKTTAGKLGVDAEKFGSCLDSGRLAGKVDEHEKAGVVVGVQATPTLFVNGRQVPGTSLADITQVIDDELVRMNRKG